MQKNQDLPKWTIEYNELQEHKIRVSSNVSKRKELNINSSDQMDLIDAKLNNHNLTSHILYSPTIDKVRFLRKSKKHNVDVT